MMTVAEFYKYITGEDLYEEEEVEESTFQKKSFEDCLDECDYDIQIKFSYLDELLCECDDAIVEIFEEIQKAEIDEEIAEKTGQAEIMIDTNKHRVLLQKKLKIYEERYDILEEMYEDMMFQILM